MQAVSSNLVRSPWSQQNGDSTVLAHSVAVEPSRARQLISEGLVGSAQIWPNTDGLGGYLVWLPVRSDGGLQWHFLAHEDSAPLRFPDAVRAHEKALTCHLQAETVTVRWPP